MERIMKTDFEEKLKDIFGQLGQSAKMVLATSQGVGSMNNDSRYLKLLLITISLILALAGLSACAKKSPELEYEKIAIHEDMIENSEYGKIDMKFKKLDGEDIRSFKAEKGKIYKFKYEAESGEIKIQFADSEGNILDRLPDGSETKQSNDNIHIGEIGGYIDVESPDEQMKIIIVGKNVEGYVNITW